MSLADFTAKTQLILASVAIEVQAIGAKIPLSQAWKIIQTATATTVLQIEQSVGNTLAGPDKKAQVLAVTSKVIDITLANVQIPYIPPWIVRMLGGWLKVLLLQIAGGSVDAIVTTFHVTNVIPVVPVATTVVLNTTLNTTPSPTPNPSNVKGT